MATIPISVTQNFLKPEVINRIFLKYVNAPENLEIIDIGAGTGNITSWLAKHTKNHVVAFEIDKLLASELRANFENFPKVSVIEKNFLLQEDFSSNYCVVANIPFLFTAAIIKKLTEDKHFQEGYLILQQEAAYRFGGQQLTQPGTLQSVLLGIDFTLKLLHTFAADDFTPAPAVTSVLLHIQRHPPYIEKTEIPAFRDFAAYLFNKSLPIIRKAPLLGRYLARAIDLGRIQLLRKKPSELSFEDIQYLFSLCDERFLEKLRGYDEKLKEEGTQIRKIHRSRTAANWRNTGNLNH